MSVQILTGDCRELLKTLPDQSVHCCVTSPPYFGLRDYGVDGQMGLEPTPDEFVAGMVAVFREVRRVLRDDGTLWLNIGDSYSSGGRGSYDDVTSNKGTNGVPRPARKRGSQLHAGFHEGVRQAGNVGRAWVKPPPGLKQKDLIGIPWMLAFALRADGWYLRQDIIWSKPNPMPESVQDRCTKAHEYVFLMSKAPRYYYDADVIAEPIVSLAPAGNGFAGRQGGSDRVGPLSGGKGTEEPWTPTRPSKGNARTFRGGGAYTKGQSFDNSADVQRDSHGNVPNETGTRNRRSVWTVATQPFSEAHFATFPPELIEPCILAGCPAGGTVLDPFGGAGTTGLVADRLQRNAILIELNPEYAAMARRRIDGDRGGLLDVMEAAA